MKDLEKVARMKNGLQQVIEQDLIPLQREGEVIRYNLHLQDGEPYLAERSVSLTVDISWGEEPPEFYNQIYLSADLEAENVQVRRYIAASQWKDNLAQEEIFDWNKVVLPYRACFFRKEDQMIFMKHYRSPDKIFPNFFRWIRVITKALHQETTA